MSTKIVHRRIRIVTLAQDETIAEHCRPGDIAITGSEEGWWVHFIGDGGTVDGYETPFDSYEKAIWTAKAAAEYSAE